MYSRAMQAYQELGLLTDVPFPLTQMDRLYLARAEVYRQQMPPALRELNPILNPTQPAIVPTNELPLGPLEHIKVLHHKQLDRYLNGEVVDNKCGICDEPVCHKDTVFKMCECAKMFCRGCIMNKLATVNPADREDNRSYLSPGLPRNGEQMVTSVQCPSCRSESYSVFGVEDARMEEERLIRSQFPQLSRIRDSKRRQNENGLYIDRIGDYCRELVQEPRLRGEYEPLFPEASKTQLLKYVDEGWLSSAQREAARLCALLESGPGDLPTLLICHSHTLLIYFSHTLLIYFLHTLWFRRLRVLADRTCWEAPADAGCPSRDHSAVDGQSEIV